VAGPTKLPLGMPLLLWASLAGAQSNLGELLDAGAKVLSAEEFRRDLVQRVIVGPMASGGSLEMMYLTDGTIQGVGRSPLIPFSQPNAPIFGQWKIDDKDRLCATMRIGEIPLAARCQYWFKYDLKYFLSDSDSDRSAKVLPRTVTK
jgi:hypothetical protein